MFRGQFVHALDEKGRVSLPARFREHLTSFGDTRVVVTPAPFDECLHLYPLKTWEEFERKISELPSHDHRIVRFRRRYLSQAIDCEVDKAGRLRISPEFRQLAHLTTEVWFAGMGKILELWARDEWARATSIKPEDLDAYRDEIRELITI